MSLEPLLEKQRVAAATQGNVQSVAVAVHGKLPLAGGTVADLLSRSDDNEKESDGIYLFRQNKYVCFARRITSNWKSIAEESPEVHQRGSWRLVNVSATSPFWNNQIAFIYKGSCFQIKLKKGGRVCLVVSWLHPTRPDKLRTKTYPIGGLTEWPQNIDMFSAFEFQSNDSSRIVISARSSTTGLRVLLDFNCAEKKAALIPGSVRYDVQKSWTHEIPFVQNDCACRILYSEKTGEVQGETLSINGRQLVIEAHELSKLDPGFKHFAALPASLDLPDQFTVISARGESDSSWSSWRVVVRRSTNTTQWGVEKVEPHVDAGETAILLGAHPLLKESLPSWCCVRGGHIVSISATHFKRRWSYDFGNDTIEGEIQRPWTSSYFCLVRGITAHQEPHVEDIEMPDSTRVVESGHGDHHEKLKTEKTIEEVAKDVLDNDLYTQTAENTNQPIDKHEVLKLDMARSQLGAPLTAEERGSIAGTRDDMAKAFCDPKWAVLGFLAEYTAVPFIFMAVSNGHFGIASVFKWGFTAVSAVLQWYTWQRAQDYFEKNGIWHEKRAIGLLKYAPQGKIVMGLIPLPSFIKKIHWRFFSLVPNYVNVVQSATFAGLIQANWDNKHDASMSSQKVFQDRWVSTPYIGHFIGTTPVPLILVSMLCLSFIGHLLLGLWNVSLLRKKAGNDMLRHLMGIYDNANLLFTGFILNEVDKTTRGLKLPKLRFSWMTLVCFLKTPLCWLKVSVLSTQMISGGIKYWTTDFYEAWMAIGFSYYSLANCLDGVIEGSRALVEAKMKNQDIHGKRTASSNLAGLAGVIAWVGFPIITLIVIPSHIVGIIACSSHDFSLLKMECTEQYT